MQSICLIIFLLVKWAIGKSDLDALLELKRGIEKDPSGKLLGSWNSISMEADGCPQDWYGISCSGGHVTSITLNDLNLAGKFDFPSIACLKMLRNLSLSNAQVMGTIDEEVGSLVSLEYLDLSRNQFLGSLPSQLTHLKKLVLLNLSSNSFEGTIPSGFKNLEQLMYLDLHMNSFSGDVMDLLTQLGSVVYIDLSTNGFSGPVDLGLGRSSFVSAIRYLNISHNNLSGVLFSHDGIPYFDNLEVFDASNNRFVGNVPSFNFIFSLQILLLGTNQLSGSLPEALLQESSMILSQLDLSLNRLQGPVGSITSATLKNLNLSSNNLSGPLPLKIGHCAVVDLSNNMLSGDLSRIPVWGNYVEIIDLSSNSLTGPLPNQTCQFLRLTSFKISNNLLEGTLPSILGTYPELKIINFSQNHLKGTLLPALFNSSRLTHINLSLNNFTGTIPVQAASNIPFADPTKNLSLVSLDLSYNSLMGHLSPDIGTFHNMLYLDLSNNHFEGEIPDNLPRELKGFNVSYNNLSGVVPENLRTFPNSAFHPGNPLLIFPISGSSPEVGSNMNLGHGGHTKSVVRAALITGLVGGAFSIALVILMLFFRARRRERGRSISNEAGKKGEIQRRVDAPALTANVNPLLTSLHLPQEQVPLPQVGSTSEVQGSNTSSRESIRKKEGTSSPISLISSANQSPSNRSPLKVCSPDKLAGDLHLFDSSLVLSAEELSCAPAEIIGRSCHGTLYKAVMGSGQELAVKWLKEGIAKGKKEFAREVKKLGNVRHPNLVSIKGYYWGPKEHEKLILSNYINAPCLALYLHETDPRNFSPLSLDQRLKIAVDVARCLNYLHHERAIPHGNLKSSNILLENPALNALLTDYSLHRIMTSAGTSDQVLNAGALGYRPPEFASTSKPCPSLKSDVYAYGVILLELLTGKSSSEVVSGTHGAIELTEWVRLLAAENRSIECFDGQILNACKMEGGPPKRLNDMLQVALRCILPASERPDMKTIFEDLSLIVLE